MHGTTTTRRLRIQGHGPEGKRSFKLQIPIETVPVTFSDLYGKFLARRSRPGGFPGATVLSPVRRFHLRLRSFRCRRFPSPAGIEPAEPRSHRQYKTNRSSRGREFATNKWLRLLHLTRVQNDSNTGAVMETLPAIPCGPTALRAKPFQRPILLSTIHL